MTATAPGIPVLPARDFVELDDEAVKLFLVRAGLPQLLTADPHEPKTHLLVGGTHPTHYLLVCRWCGQRRPHDNGYLMFGWQRATHHPDEVERQMEDFARTVLAGPPTKRAVVDLAPQS